MRKYHFVKSAFHNFLSAICGMRDAEMSFGEICFLQFPFHNSRDTRCRMRKWLIVNFDFRNFDLRNGHSTCEVRDAECSIRDARRESENLRFFWFHKQISLHRWFCEGWFSVVDLILDAEKTVTIDFYCDSSQPFYLSMVEEDKYFRWSVWEC